MLDLEALGGGDDGAIVMLGAVRFDPAEEMTDWSTYFRGFVWLKDPLLGSIDGDTVHWWFKQSQEARCRVFFPSEDVQPLAVVLRRFHEWLHSTGTVRYLWSDVAFDERLLRQAYARCGLPHPCAFDDPHRLKERDYGTLKWLGENLGIMAPVFEGVQHDAVDDALHQAKHAREILRRVFNWGPNK